MVDYDGKISCTVFTPGCDFRCPFCQNSSLVFGDAIVIDETEVFDYLEKRKGLVDAVCITGGEPTLQRDIKDFIIKVRALGYKVKLDTNGTSPNKLKELLDEGLLDYVAMDIKSDKDHYLEVAAVENPILLDLVCQSVDILKSSNIEYEFRTTIMAEYHNEEIMENIGKWIKGTKRYFIQKFKDSDTCIVRGLNEVPTEDAVKFANIIKKYVPQVKLRGYEIIE